MTCQDYERLIALYVEGDTADSGLEAHLTGCAECRDLLEDLRETRAMLKELPAADPVLLGAVRSGVLSRIGERRRLLWPWVAAAMAAAGALMMAVLHPTPQREIRVPPQSVARIAEADPVTHVAPVQTARRRRRPKPQKAAASKEPLVVKMLTDDPNIVIIWLVDQPGD